MTEAETLAGILRVLSDLREYGLYVVYAIKWALFLAAIGMGYRMARG